MKIKSILWGCLVLLVASVATAQIPCNPTALPAATPSVNWPQLQYDTAHTGCNPYEAIVKPSNASSLATKWDFDGGAFTSPVLSNGMIYGSYYLDDPFFWGGIVAHNANTGASIWEFTNYEDFSYTSPVVANGMLFAGSTDYSVLALNAKTGALVWQYYTSAEVHSTPTVANGVVYVGSRDKNVYALNAATGALIWKFTTGAAQVDASPTVSNGIVYVSADQLYALNAATGALIWQYPAGGPYSPAVAFNTVYAASGQLYALNASTGALLWKYPIACVTSPAVSKDTVYVGSDKLYALNRSTGSLVWTYTFDFGRGETPYRAPSVANGVVYDSAWFHVVALDAATGELLWNYTTGGIELFSSVVVANGTVYFSTDPDLHEESGKVYAFSVNGQ